MNRPNRSDIWLVRFPFTDLTSHKLRPALVIATHGNDVIVLGIFSRIPPPPHKPSWLVLDQQHPSFTLSGLAKSSVLRAEKIAVVHQTVFQRKLGALPADTMMNVDKAIKSALQLS